MTCTYHLPVSLRRFRLGRPSSRRLRTLLSLRRSCTCPAPHVVPFASPYRIVCLVVVFRRFLRICVGSLLSFSFSFCFFFLFRVSFLPRILHRTFPHVKHRTGMIMVRACFHHAQRPPLVRTGRHTCSLSHPIHPDTPLPVSLTTTVSSPSAIAQTHPFGQSHLGWATGHREERNSFDGPTREVERGEFLL